MFGVDGRTFKRMWTVFLFVLAVWLVYKIGSTLAVFTLAIFMAHLLGPLAERIERMVPERWMSRNVALAIVYGTMLLAIAAAMIPIAAQVGQQAAALAGELPSSLEEDPLTKIQLPAWLEPLRERLTGALRDRLSDFDEKLIPVLQDLGSHLATLMGSALAIILIPILSFFFLQDSRDIHGALLDLVPGDHRELAEEILADLHHLLVQYLRALMFLALLVFAAYAAFLYATGVQYAVLLAAVAGILEVIPVAGPLVASVIIILVALLTGYPHVWWVVVFLIAFRLIQDYVVNPHLMSSGVDIHPLLVLFGVLAGEQVAGIPGMFFSVPVIAALRIIMVRIRRQRVSTDALLE